MKKLNIALLGMGRIGKIHFRNIQQYFPNAQVVAVADPQFEATTFKEQYGDKIDTGYFEDQYGLFAIYKTGRYAVKEGFTDYDMSYQEFKRVFGSALVFAIALFPAVALYCKFIVMLGGFR